MCAELFRFLRLAIAAGEGRDMATPFVEKLQREMAKTTDPNHSYAIRRLDATVNNRRKNRDATAKQRPGFAGIHTIRQRNRPTPVRTHAVGKTTVSTDNRL